MFKNMRLVTPFDMLLNPSFKIATSFINVARTTASIENFTKRQLKKLFQTLVNSKS